MIKCYIGVTKCKENGKSVKKARIKTILPEEQLYLEGFEPPFSQKLSATNRWVQLSNQIPWDSIVNVYIKQLNNKTTGAGNVNGRVVLGALMRKHKCNLSDEEMTLQIQENMYM